MSRIKTYPTATSSEVEGWWLLVSPKCEWATAVSPTIEGRRWSPTLFKLWQETLQYSKPNESKSRILRGDHHTQIFENTVAVTKLLLPTVILASV